MKKVLSHSFHITKWTFACLLILASLILISARTLTEYVENYASDIVDQLSTVLGVPVDVDTVSAEWYGLGPLVVLEGVRLGEGRHLSTISSVAVKPDVVSSLLAWGIIWSRFEISDMDVHLEELPSGYWELAGIELGGGEGGGAYLEKMILESNRVSVQHANFSFNTLLDTEIVLNVHNMSLNHALGFHRLTLDADFGEAKNKLEFIAELTGTGSRLLDLDGLAYLKLDGQDVSELYLRASQRLSNNQPVDMQEIPSAEVELWANFRAKKQIEWQGTALLKNIPAQLLGYESGTPMATADLSGLYSAQSFSLNLQNTEIEFYSDTIDLPDVRIARTLDDQEVDYSLILPSIQVSELLDSLSELPIVNESAFKQILELNPTGQIEHLYLDVPNLNFDRWQLSGQIMSVNVDSYRTAPAVKNLSGSFSIQSTGGSIQVDSTDMALFYPKVYDHWLKHDSVNGVVSWEIDTENKNLFVYTDAVSVMGKHGPVEGAFLADIPLQANHPTGVDLTLFLGIKETSVDQQENLVPVSLSQDLRSWMDSALLTGNVPEAGVVLRGSTKRGQSKRRTAQVRIRSEDSTLRFSDRWPDVNDLDTEVWVSNTHIKGTASSAAMLDLDLADISVDVQSSSDKNGKQSSLINIAYSAQGPSASFLDVIRNYELRDQVGNSLDGIDLQGQMAATINLELPIQKTYKREDIDIQVRADISNNQFSLPDQNIYLEDVQGVMNYGNDGLQAKAVRAKLWNRPLELDLSEKTDAGLLAIDLKGAVDTQDVAKWLELDFLSALKGVAAVIGQIEIATSSKNNSPNSRYHFQTDMRGVSSSFPSPLAKAASDLAPLDITVELGEFIATSISWDIMNKGSDKFYFAINQYMDQDNLSENAKFHSARISYQSEVPELKEGIFTGKMKIDDLNLAQCLEVYKTEVGLTNGNNEYDAPYGTLLGLKPELSFQVDNLVYGSTRLGSVQARLNFTPKSWKTDIEAAYASGSVQIFEDQNQLPLLDIRSLDLNQIQQLITLDESVANLHEETNKEYVEKELFDQRTIPSMQVNIDSIVLNDIDRGHWKGTLRPTEAGLWIGNLTGGAGSALLEEEEGSSTVFWGTDDNGYFTELDLTFNYDDIGDLFRLVNIDPPMASRSGIFYASLNWDGAPYDFSQSAVNGIMGIDVQNGSFYTGEGKVPNTLLKTIGLVNVGSWVRRLRLDFKDVTAEGTPYDRLVGDFIIEDDLITTLTPVDIELSSGSMRFDGAMDMDKETVDARLVVTLPARQNVTWVAALVAGLPAAAGVWLAGKIFDDELDSLSSVSYRVEGSMDDPKVSAERMFESTITN